MNVRLQGVDVYGGGPQNHYVFRAEAQRRRRTRNLTILLATILALLIVWCANVVSREFTRPPIATANTVAVEQTLDQAPQVEEASVPDAA